MAGKHCNTTGQQDTGGAESSGTESGTLTYFQLVHILFEWADIIFLWWCAPHVVLRCYVHSKTLTRSRKSECVRITTRPQLETVFYDVNLSQITEQIL